MSDKITPFCSKVKEVSRNLKLISDKIETSVGTIAHLNTFMTDLIILADELGPDSDELQQIADVVQGGMEETQVIMRALYSANEKVKECASNMLGEDGLGPFLSREVTNPYTPIFTYKESSMPNLKDQLIRLGHEKPELRDHLRPILDKISSRNVTAGSAHIKVYDVGGQWGASGHEYEIEEHLQRRGFDDFETFIDGHDVVIVFNGPDAYDEAANAVSALARKFPNISKAFRGGY